MIVIFEKGANDHDISTARNNNQRTYHNEKRRNDREYYSFGSGYSVSRCIDAEINVQSNYYRFTRHAMSRERKEKKKKKNNWSGSRLLTSRCANISCDQFHVQTDIYGTLMVSTCNVTVPECVSANHNPSLAWFRFGT